MNKEIDWKTISAVKGVKLAAVAAGIKYPDRNDVVLMALAEGSNVSGVFTKNAFTAAPVTLCKKHLDEASIRYLVINSGNANACTGQPGYDAALSCCDAIASVNTLQANQVLPFSTGVIGEILPVDKIVAALPQAMKTLSESHWQLAAEAIMTTDTCPKAAGITVQWQGQNIQVTGISKGAGMIKPNMGTMLAYIATDANVSKPVLDRLVKLAADKSFNRITIDGDTSTNDSCILIATGQTQIPELTEASGELFNLLLDAVTEVCKTLAQAIVYDGEGATKFVTVKVAGGKTAQESLNVAYSIAHSPLVKTAMFASDPNWGRIVAAIGYADVEDLDANKIKVWLDDVLIVDNGGRAVTYLEELGQAVFDQTEFTVRVDLNRGECEEVIWTSDLSHEYIRINAEYRS